MPRTPRSQPYRIQWPLNPEQVEHLDEMIQILFDELRNGALTVDEDQFDGTLAPDQGGTGLTSYVKGDMLYALTSAVLARLTIGASGTVLKSNGTVPSWGQVDLASNVTGDLPYANLTAATAASKLLGRGDSGAGDWQEITLGTGLSMSGTTLNGTAVVEADTYWEPLTDGDATETEAIFADGRFIMVEVPF